MTNLGEAFRLARIMRGHTQQHGAAALGVTPVYLCRIEHGQSMPSLNLAEKVRPVFGVDPLVIAWLIEGDVSGLPPALRRTAKKLQAEWKRHAAKNISPGSTKAR